jgi:hypothetical protein
MLGKQYSIRLCKIFAWAVDVMVENYETSVKGIVNKLEMAQ